MNFHRLSITVLLLFVTAQTFSQNLNLQYSKTSENEIKFDVFYQGPSIELHIPARGRILKYTNQNNVEIGNNIIKIGQKNDSETTYDIRFSYSFILPNQGGFGSIGENWFPTVNKADSDNSLALNYMISSVKKEDMFIYPYLENNNDIFSFKAEQNPKIATINYSLETYSNNAMTITIYKSTSFLTKLSDVEKMYSHFKSYFGDLGINEIIILNNRLADKDTFIEDGKLYLAMPNSGSPKNLEQNMLQAWKNQNIMSAASFEMFKDAVTRLDVINFDNSSNTISTNENIEISDNTTTEVNNKSQFTHTQTDPSYVVVLPPVSYYEELLKTGIGTNTIINVNMPGMLNNYGLLHMAWIHLGSETFLAGVKALFNKPINTVSNTQNAAQEEGSTEQSNQSLETNTNKDIDWNIITQNKIQEPLFSLYTKEVLKTPSKEPILKANGKKISRNSYYIPNLSISDSDGKICEINWNGFLTTSINVSSGSYHLDPERSVPQKNALESYYTFNTKEQQERMKVLFAAERLKVSGEQNFKQHLDMIKLQATSDNAFKVPEGHTIYIIISHILSNYTGLLKDAVKETFISIDPETQKITILTTRVRI